MLIDGFLMSPGPLLEGLLEWLFIQFVSDVHFAPTIAAWLIVAGVLLVALVGLVRLRPQWQALKRAQKRLRALYRDADTVSARQEAFAAGFNDQVEPALAQTPAPVRKAWARYRATITDLSADILTTPDRPHGYLRSSLGVPVWLSGLGPLFVSIGLLFTFIGIVAVLTAAGCALDAAQGQAASGFCRALDAVRPAAMTGDTAAQATQSVEYELKNVLTGAASKFYTSIGGLAASLIVKVACGWFAGLQRRNLLALADLIEDGVAHVPEQQVAREQLAEIRKQSAELKEFNSELAVAIGEHMERAVSPMADRLDGIRTSLETANDRQMNALQEGVSNVVGSAAGGEINRLATVLGDLRAELAGLSEKLAAGGDQAAQQMSAAAERLSAVSEQMQGRFDTIADHLETVGAGLGTRMTEAGTALTEHLSASLATLHGSVEQSVAAIRSAGEDNSQSLVRLADRLETIGQDLGQQTADGLRTALIDAQSDTRKVASALSEDMASGMREASEQMATGLRGAGADMVAGLREAADQWRTGTDTAAERIGRLSEAIGHSVVHASTTAERFEAIAAGTDRVQRALDQSAERLSAATDPLAQANAALGQAAESIQTGLAGFSETLSSSLTEARTLAETMAETGRTATDAWSAYAGRFGQVDETLGQVLENMAGALTANSEKMRDFVRDMDQQCATAIQRLAGATEPLTDLPAALEDFAQRLQRQGEPAE
ncbi:hypothetical protein [Rhodothalassium salexigens]|uniref:hypothetical protein n=1 Tax=Rhodothalassium salexigens TaxID=1086 RepID=UPI0019130161|nr:hypothetical protein [Rhodothalassium salexigens]